MIARSTRSCCCHEGLIAPPRDRRPGEFCGNRPHVDSEIRRDRGYIQLQQGDDNLRTTWTAAGVGDVDDRDDDPDQHDKDHLGGSDRGGG